ncbi:MAG TPA: RNA methyltransferase [Terriglobales bacterium]|nr:RNA methyltransferase [Terriglobales bacterium]
MSSSAKRGQALERLRRVEGRHNALVKELRQAFNRGELTPSGECAVEGFRIIEEAVRSGLRFRAVFFNQSAEPQAARLLPQIGSHVETLLLPDKLFAGAVPSQTPQGVAALVHVRKYGLEDILSQPGDGPLLVIAGVQDPGNLGTILRSAEAFGARGVLLGEGTASIYNSKVVRASAGSVFRVPAALVELQGVVAELRAQGIRLLATSSHKGTPLPAADLRGRLAVIVGNEGAGIDKKLLSRVDELVMIPHSPRVESLNAGIAASILLYEIAKKEE